MSPFVEEVWSARLDPAGQWSVPERLVSGYLIWGGGAPGELAQFGDRLAIAIPQFESTTNSPALVLLSYFDKVWSVDSIETQTGSLRASTALSEDRLMVAFVEADGKAKYDKSSLWTTQRMHSERSFSKARLLVRGATAPVVFVSASYGVLDKEFHVVWTQQGEQSGVLSVAHATVTGADNGSVTDRIAVRSQFASPTSVLDACGVVHLVFRNATFGSAMSTLEYLTHRDGKWSTELALFQDMRVIEPLLAVDLLGRVILIVQAQPAGAPPGAPYVTRYSWLKENKSAAGTPPKL